MESDENYASKRRRVARACDTCRRKKIRCDGVQPGSDPPSCTNCKAYGYECSFIDAPKKRGPPKGYIEALESRLQRMESILGGLVQSGELPETALPSNLEWINVDESNFRSRDGRNPQKSAGYDQPIRNGVADPAAAAAATTSSPLRDGSNRGGRGSGGGARRDYQYGTHRNRSAPQPLSDSEDESDDVIDDDDAFSDSDSQVGDCLGDRMGQLSIDEQGMTRYLGGSSNICLLRLTNAVERGQAIVVNRRDLEKPWPRDKPRSPEVYVLPPRELCDRLIGAYFNFVHAAIPFVDKDDFMEKYNHLESNPAALILLYAMLAAASPYMDEPAVRSDPNDPSTGGLDYLMRARALLKEEFDDPTLFTVQAMLLMAATHLSAKDSAAWVYGGLAIRVAQDMGLNRDLSKWNLDARQTEVRKRTWWVCFLFDRAISATLGRPVVVHESDFDVRLPTAGAMPGDDDRIVEDFTLLIKLMTIMGRVLQHVYSIRSKRNSRKDSETMLIKLDGELNAWRDSLPQRMRYDHSMSLRDPANQRYAGIHMMYYAIQILLHRPHIRGPGSKAPPSSIPSLTICTVAANNISHAAYRSMKEDVLRIGWNHALYAFFNAAVMHVINALSGDERFREVAKHGLRMSLKCLEYLRPYWYAAPHCVNLIREMLQTRNVNLDNVGFLGDKNGTGGADGNGSGSGGVDGRLTLPGRKSSNGARETLKLNTFGNSSYTGQAGGQLPSGRTILFAPSVTAPDDDATQLADFSTLTSQMHGSATTTPSMIPQTSPRSSQHGSPLIAEDPSPSPASSTSSCNNNPGFLEFAPADFFNSDATAAANSSVVQALANFFPTNADQFHSTTTGVDPPLLLGDDDPIGNGNPFWSVPAGIDWHDWNDYLRNAGGSSSVVGMTGAVNGVGGGGNEPSAGTNRTR